VKEYLEEINPKHPILKNVGSTADSGKKEELPFYMGSLDKIKADEKALEKYKNDYKGTYIVSDKLDGNSALVYYKKGEINF
jgi:NAD-dependent DNA ligase